MFWNIRGLNKPGRFNCVRDLIKTNSLDFLALQETKKEKFDSKVLESMSRIFCGISCQ
jgi:exonuclease III